ncbi:MAG: hypothetical protein WDM80_17155 [Limisphaerales bacterium]
MPTVTSAAIAAASAMSRLSQACIQFKDITPVLADARLFAGAIDL